MTNTKTIKLGTQKLTTQNLMAWAGDPSFHFELDESAKERIQNHRILVEHVIKHEKVVYGINTGFGLMSDVNIPSDQLSQLQVNLIRSHAAGMGELINEAQTRALMILKTHSLCTGLSGVRQELVDHLITMLNHRIYPCIPSQGSVGASGDLAPLAHMALGMIGEGRVSYEGQIVDASAAFESVKIKPLELAAKEGLSLINGTQFLTALAAEALQHAQYLLRSSNIISALSLEACRGTLRAFDERMHKARNQLGQIEVAQQIRNLHQQTSPIMQSHADCDRVQDPYSFRCIPQVHGASLDTITHAHAVVERELNAVTDNPLVFDNGDVISGGNFHGQPVAMVMDFLAIAVSELGSISERRIEKLTNPTMSGLPAFLIKNGGLNSGYMIYHVTAAALASENKIYCHPAVVDSIPTSADKEDHVSMGPIASRKALEVCKNVSKILGIEAAAAAQGLDLLKPLTTSNSLLKVYDSIRAIMPYIEQDSYVAEELEALSNWIWHNGPAQCITSAE